MDTSAEEFGQVLIEYETSLTWEAMGENWLERRDGWLADVADAANTGALAELLAELEENINWGSVDDSWADRRNGCQPLWPP